jgi:AcrR family transcriptional regulator
MPQRMRPSRVDAVVHAAAQVFIAHGYRRAQIQDVADAMGVAKGTVYGYARSKEALFAAAIRYGDGVEPLPDVEELPLPTPGPDDVAALVSGRLLAEVGDLVLATAQPGDGTELPAIVLDLYARLARHRVAIKIVDRCGPELPELGAVWFGTGRAAQVGLLETYLAHHEAAGRLTLPGPPALVARTVVETCALWAVHCHFDPADAPAAAGAAPAAPAPAVDDDVVATMLAGLFTRATAPSSHPGRSR